MSIGFEHNYFLSYLSTELCKEICTTLNPFIGIRIHYFVDLIILQVFVENIVSFLSILEIVILAGNFFPTACSLIGYFEIHMTSNNETVSRQNLLVG